MKRCPQCHRLEADDTLAFCRVDGSPLAENSSEVETSPLAHTVTDPGTFVPPVQQLSFEMNLPE